MIKNWHGNHLTGNTIHHVPDYSPFPSVLLKLILRVWEHSSVQALADSLPYLVSEGHVLRSAWRAVLRFLLVGAPCIVKPRYNAVRDHCELVYKLRVSKWNISTNKEWVVIDVCMEKLSQSESSLCSDCWTTGMREKSSYSLLSREMNKAK